MTWMRVDDKRSLGLSLTDDSRGMPAIYIMVGYQHLVRGLSCYKGKAGGKICWIGRDFYYRLTMGKSAYGKTKV